MLNKNDLKLIGSFIDTKNPKQSLNFCLVKSNSIYATDTRKAIRFSTTGLNATGLIHKKMMKGLENCLDKDDKLEYQDGYFFNSVVKFSIDGSFISDDGKIGISHDDYVDIDKIIDSYLPHRFSLDDISDLQFELAQRNCFIDDIHLNPIISYNSCGHFDIFYRSQEKDSEKRVSSGTVKIIGQKKDEDGVSDVAFTAVVMGRTFESQAEETR